MNSTHQVLVAYEWPSARSAIAAYLAHLRPGYTIQAVLPADLDAALAADPGSIVVCGELTEAVPAHARGWLVLPVEGPHEATVGAGDDQRTLRDFDFDDVVAIIDDLLARPVADAGSASA